MVAKASVKTELRAPDSAGLHHTAGELARYFLASAVAFAVDAGMYIVLIRFGGVNYLGAAPCGFVLGVVAIYVLSTRWVFRQRRLADARAEFAIFLLVGVAGLLVNELVIFVCVDRLALSYELAKVVSATIVFSGNFIGRKLLLFTLR